MPNTTHAGAAPADAAHAGQEEHSLGDVLDRLGTAGEREKVHLNDVLAAFKDRSSGVLITMLGLVAALPVIGAVPGISMVVSVLILAVIVHSLIGGGTLRLPGKVGRLGVDRQSFQNGLETGRRWTRPVDRLLARRLTVLTEGRLARSLLKLMTACLAVVMFPLELVPWGVTAPAIGIVAFGLALIAHDGVFALVGYLMALATLGTVLAIF
ncbi:exopolysaccharide biosynthesis protein [Acuticoccus mangrovi]|uniref:Exopolysaccharide biosynthesis protein n=1 Tax=Acuticoccus mangrovi TaxID=2796142 RepID=A0A934MGM9_9HYPH|nr:exopolysaccharide biosynthesis protein [Acuticoccus mangrovi]MBJ3776080.1 exopolysaccharide biosynthesis protein [Acuticoccus mangrovi]